MEISIRKFAPPNETLILNEGDDPHKQVGSWQLAVGKSGSNREQGVVNAMHRSMLLAFRNKGNKDIG